MNFDVRKDVLFASLLFAFGFMVVTAITEIVGIPLATLSIGGRWFQSDAWRVFDDMSEFEANHYRNKVHPLFTVVTMPPIKMLMLIPGTTALRAIWVLNALIAGCWSAVLFLGLRFLRFDRILAASVVSAAAMSSAFLFWFAIPETYPLGSLAIAICLMLTAAGQKLKVPDVFLVIAGALSLGITLTNAMFGVAMVFSQRKLLHACGLLFTGLMLTVGGYAVEKLCFPQPAGFFLKPQHLFGERAYAFHDDSGGPVAITRAFAFHSVVFPKIGEAGEQPTGKAVTVQDSPLPIHTLAGLVAVVAWGGVFAVGGYQALWGPEDKQFGRLLFVLLAGQLLLHLMYGEETFLYSLHFLPLYVFITAFAFRSMRSRVAIAIGATFVLAVSINNLTAFADAASRPVTGNDARFSRLPDVALPNVSIP